MLKLTKTKTSVLVCLIAPLLSFVLLKPDWLARLVADTTYAIVITTLVFIYGLHPKSRIIGNGGYFAVHKSSEHTKRRASFIVRGLIIAFGCLGLYCNYLTLYDSVHVMRQGSSYLFKGEGEVVKNDTLFGIYMAEQSLYIKWNTNGPSIGTSFTATLFPRIAHQGNTYMFIIAPKSGQVLDFKGIMPNNH